VVVVLEGVNTWLLSERSPGCPRLAAAAAAAAVAAARVVVVRANNSKHINNHLFVLFSFF
jgi:hypothetical protein